MMTEAIQHESVSTLEKFQDFMHKRYQKNDRNMQYFILGFFLFGCLIAFYYDTWLYALGVGGSCLVAYYLILKTAPGTLLSRMTICIVFSLFFLQFVGQMHGLYEMHFFFFTNIAILIIYQDWRIMVPYTLIVVVHHSIFFYLQMHGVDVRIYNVNTDTITITIVVLHLGLAAFMAVVSSWWSIKLQKDTVKDFENTERLERQLAHMNKNSAFAAEISKGNLQVAYQTSTDDALGKSLQEMRESLLEASMKEEREKFKNVGIAEIGVILRDYVHDLNELSGKVIAKIVKYMQLNQGGIFILRSDDDQPAYLELTGCYAFDKKKHISRRFELGEGLVGQAAIEKNYIYMTDVPDSYINITSGLGQANPRSILVMPLKSNEEVVGIMEFASFNAIQDYEIEFLGKVAENIAASIVSAQVNERTKYLLEQSQQQAEELRAQEEEVRQNMEELQATQEQFLRQAKESEETKNELGEREKVFNITNMLSETDPDGTITYVNDKLCEVSKYAKEELLGKAHNILRHPDMPKAFFKDCWQTLQRGKIFTGMIKNRAKDGSHYWVDVTIVPARDDQGKIIKYTGTQYHLADDALAEKLYTRLKAYKPEVKQKAE